MTEPTAAAPEQPADNVRAIREDVDRNASLEIVSGQRWWTAPQLAALSSIGLADCPDADRMAFLHLCQATGLDPFRREIYLIGRKAKIGNNWTTRWTPQTGIDGFRHLAEDSGIYGGRVGPQWAGEQGQWVDVWLSPEPPRAARVGVIRNDRPARCRVCGDGDGGDRHGFAGSLRDGQHVYDDERVTWAVALFDEYVPLEDEYAGEGDRRQKTGNKVPTSMWRKMPANQIAKCAEAAAIRAAFPRRAAGLYEHAEMDAATQSAREVEESERDRQRRELAGRSWDRGGVVLDPAATAETGSSSTVDRAALWAELEEQAQAAGKTVAQWTTRWAASHKRNIDQATDAELETFLASRRSANRPVAQDTATDADASSEGDGTPDAGLTVHDVSRPSADPAEDADLDGGSREPGEGQESLIEDAPLVHEFELPDSGDDECAALGCGFSRSDPVHFG